MKSLNIPIPGCATKDLITHVVHTMKAAYVLPYHVSHIEHCCDCEYHAMSTWHIPGSYEHKCNEIIQSMRGYLPPMFIFSNKIRAEDKNLKRTKNGEFYYLL